MFVIHLLFKSLSKNKRASTYSLNKRGCLFYWLLRQAQPRANYQANLMCNNNTTWLPQRLPFASCHLEENMRDRFLRQVDITISTLIAVLSVIAVLGNLLILTAIWKKNFSRTPILIIFSGLALTDLCTGLIAQPVYITSTIVYLEYPRKGIINMEKFRTMDTVNSGITISFVSITVFWWHSCLLRDGCTCLEELWLLYVEVVSS